MKKTMNYVHIIPRSIHGQMYLVQGLSKSPHFSLGPEGVKVLLSFCSEKKIGFCSYNGTSEHYTKSNTGTVFVKTINHLKHSFIEDGYTKLMNEMTNTLWETLFSSTPRNSYRAPQLLNLGITNQKCDQYVRCTITGRVGLNLISTKSKKIQLSENALKSIGSLLMFLIDYCLPSTSLKNVFDTVDKYELEYIHQFGKQLGLTEETGLLRFVFPAISILVNRYLNAHCDKMNPTQPSDDYTMALSTQVQSSNCPMPLQVTVQKRYPIAVPMCVVIYKRKALLDYAARMRSIDEYRYKNIDEITGRTKIVSLLKSVYTDADYVGMFFNNNSRQAILDRFTVDSTSIFKYKMATIPEAVDKMAYFSPLLHMLYLYSHVVGSLSKQVTICYALFFGHQCNTTLNIVTAMLYIIEDHTLSRHSVLKKQSFYTQLAHTCQILKKIPSSSLCQDIGSGRNARHQPSNNTVYTEEDVLRYVFFLNMKFEEYSERSNALPSHMSREHFCLFLSLKQTLENELPGVGNLRASHIILLASLVGLLPLSFYVYVPMHLHGGPGTFMKEDMCWNSNNTYRHYQKKDDSIVHWTFDTMKELHVLFTTEFTPNMYENASCILGRKSRRYDTHYYLPWYDKGSKQLTIPKMQLHFRVNGKRNNDWEVEAFDGCKITSIEGFQCTKECLSTIYG
jgi:hypothetical protein